MNLPSLPTVDPTRSRRRYRIVSPDGRAYTRRVAPSLWSLPTGYTVTIATAKPKARTA